MDTAIKTAKDLAEAKERIKLTLDNNYKIWKVMVRLYPGALPPLSYYYNTSRVRQMIKDHGGLPKLTKKGKANVANNNG